MSEPTFLIQIVGTACLTKSQLWPDGDGPENPTVEDVEDLIDNGGGIAVVIVDWSIEDSFEADVSKAVEP